MLANVIVSPTQLDLQDVESRPLEENELRVLVAVSAVCGSDLKAIRHPSRPGLQIPGHEFSGKVIECYDNSNFLGKRVTAFPMFSCLNCVHCFARNFRECNNKRCLGFDLSGTFAEEVIIDQRFAIPLHDKINYEQGALVEHLCCGYSLAKEVEKSIAIDEHILIVGDGPLALADLRFLKQSGYNRITIIGKHKERMNFASSLEAEAVYSLTEFMSLGGTNNFFGALIYTIDDGAAINLIFQQLKKNIIIFPQTRIDGCYMDRLISEKNASFGRAFAYHYDDFAAVMDLIEFGEIKVDNLVTTRIGLTEMPHHLPSLYAKNKIKTLVINNLLVD